MFDQYTLIEQSSMCTGQYTLGEDLYGFTWLDYLVAVQKLTTSD